MEGRLVLVAAAVVLGCSIALPVRAYDDRTTHPALTSEMVTLYNRLYVDKKVSDAERALMLRGSTEEDITPRPLNHLYDPVHHVGWTGAKTGWVPSVLTRLASLVALLPGEYVAAVRAIDEQDNQSESGTLGFVISSPKNSEYFEHSDALGPGSGSLAITSSTVLSGIAVWMNPDGGRFCCSQAIVSVISQAGNVLAHGRGGRRQVDGPGDTTIMFESPAALVAGTYTLQIEYLDSLSNGYQVFGTASGGDWNGLGKIYMRLIE